MNALETVNEVGAGQYCGFKIGENHFGVPVVKVQEVIKPQSVTPIPMAKQYVRGLINLRGQIVTTVSLRKLFGLEERYSEEYMNIIVRSKDSLTALVVDEILDVVDIDSNGLETTPDTIDPRLKKYVKAVYKMPKGLFILLNLDEILNY